MPLYLYSEIERASFVPRMHIQLSFAVKETVTFEGCGTFMRRELIITNETALQTHRHIPFNICAHHCPIDSNCFGFYYDPTEARCVLLLSDPTSLTEITDRQSNALFSLRPEEEGLISNVARGEIHSLHICIVLLTRL